MRITAGLGRDENLEAARAQHRNGMLIKPLLNLI